MVEVDAASFLVIVAVASLAGVTAAVLEKRIAVPVVVIELLLGIVVGPDVLGLDEIKPQQELQLAIRKPDGSEKRIRVKSRIDTPIEVDYYRHGGILPYVLRELITSAGPASAKAA